MDELEILILRTVQNSRKVFNKFWDHDQQSEHFHYCQHNCVTICTTDYLEATMNVWGRTAGILAPGLGLRC